MYSCYLVLGNTIVIQPMDRPGLKKFCHPEISHYFILQCDNGAHLICKSIYSKSKCTKIKTFSQLNFKVHGCPSCPCYAPQKIRKNM